MHHQKQQAIGEVGHNQDRENSAEHVCVGTVIAIEKDEFADADLGGNHLRGDCRDERKPTFTTDIDEFFRHVDVRMKYFGALPTSTTVEVRRLSHPDLLVEIEAIAVIEQYERAVSECDLNEGRWF